jgi:hypothetical protein
MESGSPSGNATIEGNGMTVRWTMTVGTLALLLGGCAMSDDKLARMLVAPNKFALYRCEEMAEHAKKLTTRKVELEALMARAATGSGGELVNSMAYRPEYLSIEGEMMELRRTATEKKCAPIPELAGVHAPGVTAPARPQPASRPPDPAR